MSYRKCNCYQECCMYYCFLRIHTFLKAILDFYRIHADHCVAMLGFFFEEVPTAEKKKQVFIEYMLLIVLHC